MATQSGWTGIITNSDTGDEVEAYLDTAFSAVDANATELGFTTTRSEDNETDIATLNTNRQFTDATTTDVDDIVISGLYYVDTNLPDSLVLSDLEVIGYNGVDSVKQRLSNNADGSVYYRTSALGDGSDWTTWVKDAITARVDVNETDIAALQAPDYIDMNLLETSPTHNEGRFYYNNVTDTFNLQGPYAGIEVSPGHGSHIHIINNTGSTIEAGMVVRPAGIAGGVLQVTKAIATSFDNARIIGVAIIDIPDGEESAVATGGILTGLNTNGLATGTPMYLSDTVAGTLTDVPPAIRTVVGGVIVADAIDGILNVLITNNKNVPTIYGGLQGQTSGNDTYALTSSAIDIDDFELSTEVVVATDKATGVITLPNDGHYRVNFTSNISFTSSSSTRTVSIELYDATTLAVHYTCDKNVPRDATADSFNFTFPINENAGNQHKMRIRSVPDMDVTFESIVFDIQSINIV